MKKSLLTALFVNITLFTLQAQNRIEGIYNGEEKTFITKDDTYWMDYFSKGVARISRDGYVGLADTTGSVLCKTEYDKIFGFTGNKARVIRDGKFGIIDIKGREILPPSLYRLSCFSERLATFRKENTWAMGVINDEGKITVSPEYDYLSDYKNGMTRYQKDSQYGIMDMQGNKTEALKKEDFPDELIRNTSPAPLISSMDTDDMHLLMFSDNLAPVTQKIKNKQKYGYIDAQGKLTIPLIYDHVTDFSGGYAIVGKDGSSGVINTAGKPILSVEYQQIIQTGAGFFIVLKNHLWGVTDTKGKTLIPVKYIGINYLFEDVFAVFDGNGVPHKKSFRSKEKKRHTGAWGVMNSKGAWVLQPLYDGVHAFSGHLGVVSVVEQKSSLPVSRVAYKDNGFYLFFNSKKLVKNTEFRFTSEGTNPQLPFVESSDPYRERGRNIRNNEVFSTGKTYISGTGEQGIKQTYDIALPFVDDIAVAGFKKGNAVPIDELLTGRLTNYRFGVIGKGGDEKIPFIYDAINLYEGVSRKDFLPVKLNNKWGIVNYRNQEIVPFIYDYIKTATAGAIVQKNAKYGFIDFKGNELIPCEKDRIEEHESGMLQVTANHQTYIADKKGRKIEF